MGKIRPSGPGSERPRTEFRTYLDEDWALWIEEYPELGTVFGIPGYNDRWTDDSPAGIARRERHLRASRDRWTAFDRSALDPDDRLNHGLYGTMLAEAIEGLAFGEEPNPFHFGMPHNLRMPLNQMEGIHLGAADLLALQPHATVPDLEALLARLRSLPRAIDLTVDLLETGRAAGLTAPRVALRGVPEQVNGLIPEAAEATPLLDGLRERPTGVEAGAFSRLRDEAVGLYDGSVRPAFARLRAYLTDTYLPACRETVGLSALPDGAAAYAHLIRWQTTTALTPSEIHAIGLAELDRIHREMEAVRARAGFPGSLAEFFQFLRTDPRFYCDRPEELIEGYRALAKRADPGLARLFGRLPRLPYGVEPMPSFKAASSPAAYDQPGAPAAGRAGLFYANTHDLRARPRWEMEDLVLHEAVPGHHLQIALADELEDLPAFRRHSGPTAYIEGWGLYAESLGGELGFYQDPYAKMGELIADAWRSVRLVVDTGIHAFGWSRERAIRFFAEQAGRAEADIAVEVDRYIVWPGQALGYKIGALKFRELRARAEARLGARFDVRAFHDTLLAEGALPLDLVADRVEAWIRAAGAPTAPVVG
ncbi:MAG: DUF885 domain-containing protein [Thermoplasmata archaeon]